MRFLLLFMLLVAVFVVGKRSCHFSGLGIGVQGAGPTKTETRVVDGFHAIDMDISGTVEVRTGDFKVEVQAQENLLPLLKTSVENGVLRLYFDESISTSEPVKVFVTAPSFDAFSLGGSGEIQVLSPIQAEKMTIDIGGSGTVAMAQADIGALECSLSGSGEITLGGQANSAAMDVSGSGDVQAKNLKVNELKVDISGSGAVAAQVVQKLKANVSGSGDITYSGDPVVESNVSGSGSVSKQ